MRHSESIEGIGFRLRPISDEDAEFIVKLRTDERLNQYLHETSDDIGKQIEWLHTYYDRPNDYYFLIERRSTQQPEGVISVYDVEPEASRAEWGRWILRPDSLAALESCWLIYRFAFEHLALSAVYCRTVAKNEPVVSLHDSIGYTLREVLPEAFEISGASEDAVAHTIDRETWADIEPNLKRLARIVAGKLSRE